MVATKEIGTLTDTAMAADTHQVQIVNPNPFANPSMVADLEFPRILDVNSGFDNDAFSDLRSEAPKDCSFECAWCRDGGFEYKKTDDIPYDP